jgi:hypothetical protein
VQVQTFRLAVHLNATPAETRDMLRDLIAYFGLHLTAGFLVMSPDHIRQALASEINCTRQTRKLVWLVWALFLRPGTLQQAMELSESGRFTANSGPQHAGKPPMRPLRSRIDPKSHPKRPTRPKPTSCV